MIGRNGTSQARQVRVRALGSSAMTVALMLAGPAFAQCVPGTGNTVTCTGTDADGLRVLYSGPTILVQQGATVNAANGDPAIEIGDWARLTNNGTIVGDVVAGTNNPTSGTTVDSTGGRITGSLTFGSTADTLVATYDGTQLRYGVDGAINGGTGTDIVRVRFAADGTIAAPLALPTAFERVSIAPDAGRTTTLATGFTASSLLLIGGNGTIVNNAALSATGQGIGNDPVNPGAPAFVNAGSVALTGTGGIPSAINLTTFSRFENSGTVTSSRYGVTLSGAGPVVNSGTITANLTALSVTGDDFTNTATGILRSANGIGLLLTGGVTAAGTGNTTGTGRTNAGTIEGAVGTRLGTVLINSGAITGTRTGAVFSGNGTLDNRAGGTVTGPVAISAYLTSAYMTDNTVLNAGTITGDVVLGDSTDTVTRNNNRYFALPGGVLNGNLTLGRSDLLVTELVNTGPGAYAGITGQVNATRAALRLRVRADGSTTQDERAGFRTVGYELFDNARLTVTGTSDQTLVVAGRGSVDLNGDIAAVLRAAIQTGSVTLAPGETATANALTITSNGAISLLRTDDGLYSGAAVMLNNADIFTNAGTITVTDRATQQTDGVAAISGGANSGIGDGTQVTNSGRIALTGATGIRNVRTITNTGTVVQRGSRPSTGIVGSSSYRTTLTNAGTISVGGNAVRTDTGAMTINNSGLIASTGDVAIAIGGVGTISNAAGGRVEGGADGQTDRVAIRMAGGTLTNAGTITGTVDLGYGASGRGSGTGTYIQDGGTIAGNLLFGSGNDTLVAYNALGINGTIDGGDGIDTLVHARRASDTVTLGRVGTTNFERESVRTIGADTVVTLAATNPVAGSVMLTGTGAIVNTATLQNAVLGTPDQFTGSNIVSGAPLGGFTNQGTIAGTVDGKVDNFTNTGTIAGTINGKVRNFNNTGTISAANVAADSSSDAIVRINTNDTLAFVNSGTINTNDVDFPAAFLTVDNGSTLTASNTGTINGSVWADMYADYSPDRLAGSQSVSFTNTGTITSAGTDNSPETLKLFVDNGLADGASVTFDNKGLVDATSAGGAAVVLRGRDSDTNTTVISATNSGTIRANAGEKVVEEIYNTDDSAIDRRFDFVVPSVGMLIVNDTGTTQLTNTASGVIEATGTRSVAIAVDEGALDLTNAGIIRGGAGSRLADPDNSSFGHDLESDYLPGAILTSVETYDEALPSNSDRIVNTGTIIGSIDLGAGDDRIENYGRIEGDVFLGAGNDTFLHRLSATLVGTVDAGEGDDSFIVDATGGGTLNGDQFVNFERFSQTGSGTVNYTGNFQLNTIDLSGGTISVAAGQTLTSDGPITITGSEAVETIVNAGTIAGGVSLGAGNDDVTNSGMIGGEVALDEGDDRVVNMGTIGSAVSLGAGDDSFVDGANSVVASGVDGGTGIDSYTVVLAGDRSGINARTGFERLSIDGNGTLTLGLDQSFDTVTLTGTGLTATLNGFSLGTVTGSGAGEALRVDGDVATASLGAGDDLLSIGTQTAAGSYDGGTGSDTLAFTATGPVTLSGTATGFEQVALTNGALTVAGTLGTANAPLAFGDGAQSVTVASGGTLAGVIDLGTGNDALRLAAGSTLNGTVAGGAGSDSATLVLTGDRSLASTMLTGFETLASEGTGTLTLTGTHAYDTVNAATGLTLASGSTLTAPQVRFGSGDQRFTIAGGFTGAVDGGAGSDTLALSGGSAAAPVAFTTVTNVEALAMSGGFATVSGNATLGSVDLTGGRLVGLAGSVLNGSFAVRSGATFGSAGTVNGNVTVAGTLSPGASPGTMTVNGNVSLASGSVSLFEFTPTAQDKLVVNGTLSIASGATLQLTQSGTLRPGVSYDLITASGGITGSFSSILKPDTLFGFVVQNSNRIQLLGQFQNDAGFAPQVSRSIAYANDVLIAQPATSSLFAVLPALVTASGGSNTAAFARLTPEAYASATQAGVETALALSDIARGPGFAANRSDAGGFTFGQAIGSWYRLAADPAQGVSRAATNSYGVVGGIGYGDSRWSAGAFAGFVNSRQRIDALAARSDIDGWVAGVQGRYQAGRLGLTAAIAYQGGKADTDRALPVGGASRAGYDLDTIVGDLSAHYTIDLGDWALRPRAGLTYIRTSRDRVVEAGGPFALTVAADRHVASFADAGVGFARAETSDAAFRPFVALGLRYQLEGQRADAVAGYAGAPLALVAYGAGRARTVATISAGLVQRVTDGLDLFSTVSAQSGSDDRREAISTGARLRF